MMKLMVMTMIVIFIMMVVTDDADQDYLRSGGLALWI